MKALRDRGTEGSNIQTTPSVSSCVRYTGRRGILEDNRPSGGRGKQPATTIGRTLNYETACRNATLFPGGQEC